MILIVKSKNNLYFDPKLITMEYSKLPLEISALTPSKAYEVRDVIEVHLNQDEIYYTAEQINLYNKSIELCSVHHKENKPMGLVFTIFGN